MPFNKHPKRKIARKLMSDLEIKLHIPVFDSKGWIKRKENIFNKVAKRQNHDKVYSK